MSCILFSKICSRYVFTRMHDFSSLSLQYDFIRFIVQEEKMTREESTEESRNSAMNSSVSSEFL